MEISTPADRTTVLQVIYTSDGSALAPESLSLWQRYTGQTEKNASPWGWLTAVHPDDCERVKQQWKEAVSNARMFTTQYRLRTAENSELVVTQLCVPLFKEAEKLEGWVGWVSREQQPAFLMEPANLAAMFLPAEIAAQAPLGVVCLSLDYYFIQVNERYCQIAGYPQTELIERRLHDILPSDLHTMISLNLRHMLIGHLQNVVYETFYPHPDGQTLWLKVTSTLVWHPQGIPRYFLTWVEDLSLQKRSEQERGALLAREQAAQVVAQQAEQEASALNAMLQTIFHNVIDGVIIYDPNGRVLNINKSACVLLEVGAEEDWLGNPFADLFHDYQTYQTDGDRMQFIPTEHLPILRMQRGEPVPKTHVTDLLVRFPSGRERYFDLTSTPLYDHQGRPTALVTIFRDVTARHERERRIRKAFHTLSHVMEAMISLPLHADPHTTEEGFVAASLPVIGQHLCEMIRQFLDCAMVSMVSVEGPEAPMYLVGISGFSQHNLAHLQQDLTHSTLSDYFEEATIAQLQANQVVLRNLVAQPFVRRSTYGMHNFLLAPMLLGGRLIGTFGIDQPGEQKYSQEDIALVKALAKLTALVLEQVRLLHGWTQAHANELALQETNRRFDAFLSLASHELRTPLAGIRGCIQLVLRRLEKLARQEQMASPLTEEMMQRLRHPLEEAITRATAQDRMISDLLDASRIQADKLEIIRRPANLIEIIQHSLQDIQYFAPERVITLHAPVEEWIPVLADMDRIGQVVSNYLSNAVKYSAADQPVELWLTKEGEAVRVAVKDHGPGLTPEEQQVMWERFHRVKGIEVQYGTGASLGLGLYLCRTIIERHGGQVGVESTKGQGSTFWFTLPLTPERSPA